MAYLTQFSNSVPVIKFPIDQSLMSIGQDIEMDICVPEEGIAENHALLEVTQQDQSYRFVVKPITQEPIQLNGETVSQAELKDGDWLLVGDIEFQFTDDGVNEIKEANVVSFNQVSAEPVTSQAAEVPEKQPVPEVQAPEEEAPAVKAAQLLRESRFSRRLGRY